VFRKLCSSSAKLLSAGYDGDSGDEQNTVESSSSISSSSAFLKLMALEEDGNQ